MLTGIVEKIVALASKLQPQHWHLFVGVVDMILSAKTPEEAAEKLRKAGLAVGYKKAAKESWRAAVKGKGKL